MKWTLAFNRIISGAYLIQIAKTDTAKFSEKAFRIVTNVQRNKADYAKRPVLRAKIAYYKGQLRYLYTK